jgi:hypothetical protein
VQVVRISLVALLGKEQQSSNFFVITLVLTQQVWLFKFWFKPGYEARNANFKFLNAL